jgi:hypothetical protein
MSSHRQFESHSTPAPGDETLALLTDIRDSLRRLEERADRTGPSA